MKRTIECVSFENYSVISTSTQMTLLTKVDAVIQ